MGSGYCASCIYFDIEREYLCKVKCVHIQGNIYLPQTFLSQRFHLSVRVISHNAISRLDQGFAVASPRIRPRSRDSREEARIRERVLLRGIRGDIRLSFGARSLKLIAELTAVPLRSR